MNLNSFLSRRKLKHRELAKMLECSQALVGRYAYNSATPSYENIVKLLKIGMTIEELFGEDVADKVIVKANSSRFNNVSEDFKDEVIREICNRLSKNRLVV